MASEMTTKPRMCLHFDINKTIIMSDVVSGRTMTETLSSLLSECTWGLCEPREIEHRSAADWVACHPNPTNVAPMPGAVTLGTYLEDHTLVPKKEQTRIKRAFTQEGNLGHHYLPYQDDLIEAMRFVPAVEGTEKLHYLSSGYYHIIPSFFRLVEYLAEMDIEFNILFRTFGVDIENVCSEFNLFCTGGHPAYVPSRRLDGTDPLYRKDLRIRLPHFHGKFSHTGFGSEGLHMKYVDDSNNTVQVSGADAVYKVIMQDWFDIQHDDFTFDGSPTSYTEAAEKESYCPEKHTHCAAVQDDFHWWHTDNDESEHSGKLMLVDTSFTKLDPNTTKEEVIQVFFDDNIERSRAHIVDVRNAATYAPVPFEVSQGRYLRRVDPYQAILDKEYYVKEVQSVFELYK